MTIALTIALVLAVLLALLSAGSLLILRRSTSGQAASVEEHRESGAFLESIIEGIPLGVAVKRAEDFRYVQVNRTALSMFGVHRDDMIGRRNRDFLGPEQATMIEELDRRVLLGGVPFEIEAVKMPARFGARTLSVKKIPIVSADGVAHHLLEISEDVTDRMESLHELETAWAQAERANEAKSEFLSRMSHELRTPLNAVLGFGQLLEFDELPEQQASKVQQILRGGRHLLGLINEVLDISRIESGNLSLSLEPVALEHLIGETLELVRPLADDGDLGLPKGSMPDWSVWVRADQQRLRQVLLNLLSNAVKYNEPGGSIAIRCTELHGRRLRISVTDTGRGLSQDQVDRLFSPFERLGAEESGIQGTGLGLALSKRLVEAMNGTIGLETEPGIGSTFWIELGLCDASDILSGSAVSTIPIDRTDHVSRLLHVEDSLESLRWVEHLLGDNPDVELISVADAETAFDMATRFQPDLLLLDLDVAGTDPGDLVARLARHEATGHIVVVTIGMSSASVDGVDRHLVRPVTDAALLAAVADGLAIANAAAHVEAQLRS